MGTPRRDLTKSHNIDGDGQDMDVHEFVLEPSLMRA